jgi:gamma-glutamylcysteine synthetase
MSRTATFDQTPRIPIRAAVLDLLARAAPKPAALGAPSAEEQEFLDTLRRIVARSNAEELWDRYHGGRSDPMGRIFARYQD